MDIFIKNAKLREKRYPVNIAIKDGIIKNILPAKSELNPEIEEKSKKIINAFDHLVTPTFIEPHIHLDRAFITSESPTSKTIKIEKENKFLQEKKKIDTVEDIIKRASKAVTSGLQNGVTKFRTHVDIDSTSGLKGLEALVEIRKKFKDVIDIQIVAFPSEGIFNNSSIDKLMKKAMKKGADIVGGMPYKERIDEEARKHIDFCFKLAKQSDADIDMHIGETHNSYDRNLQYLAVKTIKENYNGRVTASQTNVLSVYDNTYASKVISLISEAGIHIITTPATNLMLQGGTTKIKQLIATGINIAYGQDFIKDSFYQWGKVDPLDIGMLTAHTAKFNQPHEIETLFNMPTSNSAKIFRLKKYGIEEDSPADLNIIDATTVQEAFRKNSDRLYVISKGNIVATNKTVRTLNL